MLSQPVQPPNEEPLSALAVRVTGVPSVYASEQSPPQLIPPGALVTEPLPAPDLLTLRIRPVTGSPL